MAREVLAAFCTASAAAAPTVSTPLSNLSTLLHASLISFWHVRTPSAASPTAQANCDSASSCRSTRALSAEAAAEAAAVAAARSRLRATVAEAAGEAKRSQRSASELRAASSALCSKRRLLFRA